MANEKRLIYANKFMRETYFQEGIYPHSMIKKEIEAQPTVDAVEVVRCKDCIAENICAFSQFLGEDGFCSCGERRTE